MVKARQNDAASAFSRASVRDRAIGVQLSQDDGQAPESLSERVHGRAGIRSMDTMDQMEYMVRRMLGKTHTYRTLPT